MDDPFFSMTTMVGENSYIDLWQLGFMFAVEDVDPRLGRLEVQYVAKVSQEDGNYDHETETTVDMADCRTLPPEQQNINNGKFTYEQLLHGLNGRNFLCPVGLDSLELRGAFGFPEFDYLKIVMRGCDLGPTECYSDEQVSKNTFNFVILKALPNILGEDHNQVVQYK